MQVQYLEVDIKKFVSPCPLPYHHMRGYGMTYLPAIGVRLLTWPLP